MRRKPSPFSSEVRPLTGPRIAELAEILLLGDSYELGPEDRQDLMHALAELVERRVTKNVLAQVTIDERSAA